MWIGGAQRVTTLVDGKDGERGISSRRVFEQRREAEGVGVKRVPVVPATRLAGPMRCTANSPGTPPPCGRYATDLAVGRRVEVGQAAQNRLPACPWS